MTPGEVRRLYFIVRTFLNYGIDELIPKIRVTIPLRLWCYILFWIPNRHKNQQLGVRLKLAFEELGPVWVKLGQMLSTRRDLFLPQITDQLALLQDKVLPFNGRLAKKQIEEAMGNLPIETWFDNFNITPLASASMAQVHTARLKRNGKEVVIKVIRPDILPVIKEDIKLIYRIARWITYILPDGRLFRPIEVVREYERTLIDELNLLREAANAIQLRRNFKNSQMLYVPEVYFDCCKQNIMVMERIYGIAISDIVALKKNGTNMKLLAERGVQIFFTQVFRDSFFHADMHPGNIFVSYDHPDNPQYIGVDYGIVGSLNKEDKRYLAENFIAFFNRDYRKVAELHIKSGWVPPDTNIEDFEFSIRTVCEPIFEKPLAEISFGNVLFNLFKTARRFNMEIQPQLILLKKNLFYVEGLGRQLYPQLDLWKTAKPFLESWIQDQIGITGLMRSLKNKTPSWIEKIPEIPELMYDSLYQIKKIQYNINVLTHELKKNNIRKNRFLYTYRIGTVLLVSGILLLIKRPEWRIISLWLIIGSVFVWLSGWYKIR